MTSKSVWMGLVAAMLLVHCGGDDGGGGGGGGGSSGGTGGAGAAGASGEAGSGGTGATGGTGGTGGGGTLCEQRCAKTAELNCPNDANCVAICQSAIDYAPWCSDIMSSFVTCAEARPVTDWACDGTGHSALVSGVCETEAQAGISCVANGPPAGMPDLSAECTATCNAMSSLPCAPANCVQTCNDKIANGPCAGAVGLVTVCGAKLTAADYQCVQDAPVPLDGKCGAEINLLVTCLQAQGG